MMPLWCRSRFPSSRAHSHSCTSGYRASGCDAAPHTQVARCIQIQLSVRDHELRTFCQRSRAGDKGGVGSRKDALPLVDGSCQGPTMYRTCMFPRSGTELVSHVSFPLMWSVSFSIRRWTHQGWIKSTGCRGVFGPAVRWLTMCFSTCTSRLGNKDWYYTVENVTLLQYKQKYGTQGLIIHPKSTPEFRLVLDLPHPILVE
jgi:hypothetical protein